MNASKSGLIEVIDQLASDDLFAKACAICAGNGWYFGNRSSDQHAMPFWKMDLDGDPVFDAIWEAARPQCEQLAGRKLRVIRQYGNGHTYGLGGQPHRDDNREGTFTLLYYPMAEWNPEWQGETVFHDEASGEIEMSVNPRPNRAVFFNARIPHAGRAPSRSCPALRVTVAYKLEAVDGEQASSGPPHPPVSINELARDGANRIHEIRVLGSHVSSLVAARLQTLSTTLRVPGYRPGKIPMELLQSRYGARTRREVLGQLAVQAADLLRKGGNLPAALHWINGADSGDVVFRLEVTHLPDLPEAGAEDWILEQLTASDDACNESDLGMPEANALVQAHFHLQVLDRLDETYGFAVAPPLIDKELEAIRSTLDTQSGSTEEDADEMSELRKIAERRVKLGAVMLELARRHRIASPDAGPELERHVIEWLASRAKTTSRPATAAELREMAGDT